MRPGLLANVSLSALALSLLVPTVRADHHDPGADGLDEVVAKHIAGKGGREAWNQLESLEFTGEYTAFSKISPFVLRKTRDRKYFMDSAWGDQSVVAGFDGETAWWDNRFFGKGARFIEGADRAVLERDLDFATPLFDLETAGHVATLLGLQDLDGMEVIAIELQRADQSKETWYLDPSTYLEAARDSPGSDFGEPMTQRTFFDDFRSVAGVMIPFHTETEWYTRHRVMELTSVEANVDLDEDIFSMPPPIGMEEFQDFAGSWSVAIESRQNPGAEFTKSQAQSKIESHLRGGLFVETWTGPDGSDSMRTLSYDQFRDRYLATSINSSTNVLDILAGGWNEDGALVVDDLVTETPALLFGMTIYERMKIFEIEPDSFTIERENSIDGGETWATMEKLAYTRSQAALQTENPTP